MTRLYLTDRDRYRVRMTDARVVQCRWDDAAFAFVTGRGQERRTIDMSRVAAVSSLAHWGRCRIVWYPFDRCYRAKHAPKVATWVHPYARRDHATRAAA